jgi:hypothetical protein
MRRVSTCIDRKKQFKTKHSFIFVVGLPIPPCTFKYYSSFCMEFICEITKNNHLFHLFTWLIFFHQNFTKKNSNFTFSAIYLFCQKKNNYSNGEARRSAKSRSERRSMQWLIGSYNYNAMRWMDACMKPRFWNHHKTYNRWISQYFLFRLYR